MVLRNENPGGATLNFFNAAHAVRCVACHGVRSHPVPVAFVLKELAKHRGNAGFIAD